MIPKENGKGRREGKRRIRDRIIKFILFYDGNAAQNNAL
jgi:hypothetical protein